MNTNELAALLPLDEQITASYAASILGGAHRLRTIMDLVVGGRLCSWSHSVPGRDASIYTNHDTGEVKALPYASPDTDPSTVLVESNEVLWLWCAEAELSIQGGGKLPAKELVEARLANLQHYANTLKYGTAPAGNPAPAPTAAGRGKRWTLEELAEMKAYRTQHGTKATAAHYGISASLVRQKLPGDKQKSKGYSVYTHISQ